MTTAERHTHENMTKFRAKNQSARNQGQSTKTKVRKSLVPRPAKVAWEQDYNTTVSLLQLPRPSLVPRPFLCGRGEREEERKGLVNNTTQTRICGCIPAVSVDEGKCECQGISRE